MDTTKWGLIVPHTYTQLVPNKERGARNCCNTLVVLKQVRASIKLVLKQLRVLIKLDFSKERGLRLFLSTCR